MPSAVVPVMSTIRVCDARDSCARALRGRGRHHGRAVYPVVCCHVQRLSIQYYLAKIDLDVLGGTCRRPTRYASGRFVQRPM